MAPAALAALARPVTGRVLDALPEAVDPFALSLNENPFPPLPAVRSALIRSIDAANRYPEFLPEQLRTLVANRIGVRDEQVVLGAGVSGVVMQILHAVTRPGDRIVLSHPTFDGYPIFARMAGLIAVPVPLDEHGYQDLAAMADAAAAARVVVLCRPHNPTGTLESIADVRRLLRGVPDDTVVLLDEAYIEFVADQHRIDGPELVRRFPNVVVLRTFSKAYGLAGLRIGYGFGAPKLAGVLWAMQLPFGMDITKAVAVAASYDAEGQLQQRVRRITGERAYLCRRLRAMGVRATDGHANFVYLPAAGPPWPEVFGTAGVQARYYPDGGVRISVGSRASSRAVLAAVGKSVPVRSRPAALIPAPGPPTHRSLRILVVGAGAGGVSVARRLWRDGHDVTVFERRPALQTSGGAVTIWSNGATVLGQLGVDMDGAGQLLSSMRVATSTGRRLATVDLTVIAPVRMVPRRVLLDRLLDGFPAERIRCNSRAVGVVGYRDGVRVEFDDGSCADGDVLIGADGLHSMVREVVGAPAAQPTGWCSWQGLVSLPDIADEHAALFVVGEHGNVGLWPAGGTDLQWWFDLPWSVDFVRPEHPIELIRSSFTGWSDPVDRVLATLTDDDLAPSPFPHFRHPIPRAGRGAVTLLGDAAHTMPPILAQGTNQALLDTMVLGTALSDFGSGSSDVRSALRWYEHTRRRPVTAVSWVASRPVSHGEAVLRPAAMIPDRFMTGALSMFLRILSHRRIAERIRLRR